MKKLIATILVLAMVLTMALTVSAAPRTTFADLMDGDEYEVLNSMAPPAMHVVAYTLTFQRTSLGGGILTIVDDNYSGFSGTYTYTFDGDAVAITVEDGNTGDPEAANYIFFTIEGETLMVRFGMSMPQECIPADGSGTGPVEPEAIELTLGANDIDIAIENFTAKEVAVTFTATEAGTYIIAAADGEENASIGVEDQYGSEWFEAPYEVTLAAGETFEGFISSNIPMPGPETSDTINLIITKKVDAPAGGNSGSPENGDSTALYVAVAAVALASIFGCAIVSKKRIAE